MTNCNAWHRFVLAGSILFVFMLGAPGSADAAKVKFAWDPVTTWSDGTPLQPGDLGGYKLYYGTITALYNGTEADEGASPITLPINTFTDVNNPTAELTGLATCQYYYFAVTAYDSSNNESGYSNEVAATIVEKPVLSPLQVVGSSELRVMWSGLAANDPGRPSGYLVHYDTDSGVPYNGVGSTQGASPVSVAANLNSLRLTGLNPSTTYYVMVESTCSDGTRAASTEASGTTGAPQVQPDMGVPPPQPDMGVPPPGVDAYVPPPQPDMGYTPPPPGVDQGAYPPPPGADAYAPPGVYRDGGAPGLPASGGTLEGGCSVGGAPSALPLFFLMLFFVLRRRRSNA